MPNDSKSSVPHKQEASDVPAIVLHDITKTFELKHNQSFKEALMSMLKREPLTSSFNAVDHVTFSVPEGQSVAVMGRNGSGKSTTLKLISGVMRPDHGWVRTRGRVAGLLEVGAGFHPNLTGRENVYLNAAILGMSKEETDAQFENILAFSEIGDFIDTEVKHYSSGMYSRLGFAVAVHTELDVLLVDEVLSVGDAQFRDKCHERMLELQDQGKTMFVVSHSAEQVKKLCERGIVLDKGKVVFDGDINDAVDFLRPLPKELIGAPKGGWPVDGPIKALYKKQKTKFGRAFAEQVTITENGGGTMQVFENGVITHSDALNKTIGIGKGTFSRVYLENGGAAGEWGFLNGQIRGKVADGTRALVTQNGIARYSTQMGVEFEPHETTN